MKKFCMVLPLAMILCFVVGCQDKEAMAELEEFRAQAAVEEVNKELARSLFSAIDKNDFDKLRTISTEDFSFMGPGLTEPLGLETTFSIIKAAYSAFPDWTHTIEEVVAENDWVAVKIFQSGTHKAPFEGVPATGLKVSMPAQVFLKISDGKIKEFWAVEDYLSFFQQFGMELKPKEGE